MSFITFRQNIPVYQLALLVLLASATSLSVWAEEANTAKKVELGRAIFLDTSLSEPAGQACASCHTPDRGFADPDNVVSAGANPQLFGNRNAPSISYVRFNPEPEWNGEDETWIGGFFLDGRARTLREQAKGPLLNPLEMGNHNGADVIAKIKTRPYAKQFLQLYGQQHGEQLWENTDVAFDAVADALATYEREGKEFAPFSSKYDAYLRGEVKLTVEEKRGLEVFEDEEKGNCAACHPSQRGDHGEMPLFTDYSYDNIGVPRNKALPFLNMAKQYNPNGKDYVDMGLGNTAYATKQDERGKFKVQSLRNIAHTAPYMHNGVFNTLKEVVEFYNTRDTDKKWGKPEVAENVNKDELGDLKLTEQDVNDLVAFLKTLSDRYTP